ncbi:hypothetical protein QVM41_02285 [Pseudomonas shirazica]
MLPIFKTLTVSALLLSAAAAMAAEPRTADDIIRQARDRDDGKSFMSQVSLILIDKQGKSRIREFSYLQKDYPDSDKFTMYFAAPSDVRDVALAVARFPGGDLDRESAAWGDDFFHFFHLPQLLG